MHDIVNNNTFNRVKSKKRKEIGDQTQRYLKPLKFNLMHVNIAPQLIGGV